MELPVTEQNNPEASNKIDVDSQVFDQPFNEPLVHQVVIAYQAGMRAGTKAQKSRSDVQGGGKKPWRQKGTGRARAGTIRSPIWRSGGKTFAASPRQFSQKVNKKMYCRAMAAIFSELVRQGRVTIVDEFSVAEPRTKLVVSQLAKFDAKKVLIVLDKENENVALGSRNVPNVSLTLARHVNPLALVGAEHVVLTVAAVKQLEERLK